ncbi:hypothetical protein OH77DRAFT_1189180 [Trametes cingulata]|nr:hypothetical protein OH77DRAFT_1189180 [Trametes cingulata]
MHRCSRRWSEMRPMAGEDKRGRREGKRGNVGLLQQLCGVPSSTTDLPSTHSQTGGSTRLPLDRSVASGAYVTVNSGTAWRDMSTRDLPTFTASAWRSYRWKMAGQRARENACRAQHGDAGKEIRRWRNAEMSRKWDDAWRATCSGRGREGARDEPPRPRSRRESRNGGKRAGARVGLACAVAEEAGPGSGR